MNDKRFVDTNILLYLVSDDLSKKMIAKTILANKPVISTQVLNELSNVCIKKLKIQHDQVVKILEVIEHNTVVVEFSATTIRSAIYLHQRYKLQYYDSLIVATALEHNCSFLLSEDMQNNMIIDDRLTIINPFKS